MPWHGMADNLIDRFDGRAYLEPDCIPKPPIVPTGSGAAVATDGDAEITSEERTCNYERYRILAQNDFLAISEEKYLHQLHLEEQFGIQAQLELEKPNKGGKAKNSAGASSSTGGVAIGYTYEDSTEPAVPTNAAHPSSIGGGQTNAQLTAAAALSAAAAGAAGDDDSDSDLDVDVAIDISKIDTAQAHELNACGRHYGMRSNDFYSFLTKDADEADALKVAREEEQEKIMLSGRKSRRERRAQRERRWAGRAISPPSYAAREEPPLTGGGHDELDDDGDERPDSGDSRSPSPENSGKITYITSFGGDDEPKSSAAGIGKLPGGVAAGQGSLAASALQQHGVAASAKVSYADKVRENLDQLRRVNSGQQHAQRSPSPDTPLAYKRTRRRRSYSRSRSRSRSYDRRGPGANSRGRVGCSRRRGGASARYQRSRSRSPRSARHARGAARRRTRSRSRSSRSSRSRSRSRSRSYGASHRSRKRRYSTSSSSSTSPASSYTSSSSRSRSRSRSRGRRRPMDSPPSSARHRRRQRYTSSSSSSSSDSSRSTARSRRSGRRSPGASSSSRPAGKSTTTRTPAPVEGIPKARQSADKVTTAAVAAVTTPICSRLDFPALIACITPAAVPLPAQPLNVAVQSMPSGTVEMDQRPQQLPAAAAPLPVPVALNIIKLEEPVIPIKRYYGRKRDDETSSEDDDDDADDADVKPNNGVANESAMDAKHSLPSVG